MSTITTQQEFPIAFAEEIKSDPTEATEFYVEWLEDSSEFPVLASDDKNLTAGHWELLQKKDIFDDEEGQHILIPVEEEDEWSKLNAVEKEELYSKIIEKNAQELQPKTFTVRPLWSHAVKKETEVAVTDDEDEMYEDDLGAELVDHKKSQSRRTSRLSNRRRVHDLKTVDLHVHGLYKLVTHQGVQAPSKAEGIVRYKASIGHRSDKATALILCSKYAHNLKKRAFKHPASSQSKQTQCEHSEYNVHSNITYKGI